MGFIPVDKGIEGIMVYTLDSQKVVNTYWFKAPAAPTESNLLSVLTLLEDFWVELSAVLSNDLAFDHREAHDRTSSTGRVMESSTTTQAAGGVSGGTAPNSIALCVSHRTGYQNRSARGRTFIAGIPRAYFSGNTALETLVDGVKSAYDGLIVAANTAGLPLCVASKYHDGAPRTLGVMTTITNVVINNQLDSQRRRMPGYGD